MEIRLGDIAHIIQLSIAPVFLLTGVGTTLLVLTNRLARIIDRSRALEEKLETPSTAEPAREEGLDEVDVLYRRARMINRAITLSTTCALLICLVVVALFVGDALNLHFGTVIAALFVLAMVTLTSSFICLLREIFMAMDFLNGQRRRLHRRLGQ